ncbi:hypothetical protein JX580_02160 [Thiomicrospira microaerophila]|uniref:hypothetical protein n=1 Tax=Thiomicrospira microaerophila TaxID=406020 RepID=UPI00200C9C1E|nr:hypothetical protein [Thiomicrospira microaerophila]UQB42723.1 hypothetical protein JX580_02160 [Thiomicrospira microaerophila]
MLDKYYAIELAFLRELPTKYQSACRLILTHEPFSSIYYSKGNLEVFSKYFQAHLPDTSDVDLVYKRLVLIKLTYLNPSFFELDELKWMLVTASEMLERPNASMNEIQEEMQYDYPVFSQWLSRCLQCMQRGGAKIEAGVVKDTPDKDMAWCK